MYKIHWIIWSISICVSNAYRILSDVTQLQDADKASFEPYVRGNAGYFGDPVVPLEERVNEGSPFSPDTPRIFFQAQPKQNCPGMVGPIRDEEYYCHGREYGYCDRRLGLCVCNEGYTGIDCTECRPSYLKIGGLCYPKRQCPNDCSQGGTCDYMTGKCSCYKTRKGEDCSERLCQFDPLCQACTATKCVECFEGYYVEPVDQSCVSCKVYDPRCLHCDHKQCLECADPLLNSVYRSGARGVDMPLPQDELIREFSFKFPYGGQDPRIFDEVETFYLLPASNGETLAELHQSAETCQQGLRRDESWDCSPAIISHRVCGHEGVFTFRSPLYEIDESAEHIPITVRRSGGGMGKVTISYSLEHVTTSDDDVSATAHYTSSKTLVFEGGVIEMTFFVTIHDDHIAEEDEEFRLHLHPPEPPTRATLGNQKTALVIVRENDRDRIDASKTFITSQEVLKGGQAGDILTFTVQAVASDGRMQVKGGERLLVETWISDDSYASQTFMFRGKESGAVLDNNDGTYYCSWSRQKAGNYTLAVFTVFPGGLRGEYYGDLWLQESTLVTSRIDHQVNFTWGTGSVVPAFMDNVAVRWSGWIEPKQTEMVTFYIEADDKIRFWLNDILLIDGWGQSFSGHEHAAVYMETLRLYAVRLEYREYRHDANVHLYWSGATWPKEIVPSTALYNGLSIANSPMTSVPISPIPIVDARESVVENIRDVNAGEDLVVKLIPRDAFGNHIRTDRTRVMYVDMHIVDDHSDGGSGSLSVSGHISWNNAVGSVDIHLLPTRAGIYDLKMYVERGSEVFGSPFRVTVSPASINPSNSLVSGAGLLPDRIAGEESSVLLVSRDYHRNRIYTGGSSSLFTLYIIHNDLVGEVVLGNVEDFGDGTYSLHYMPRKVGSYSLQIFMQDMHVDASPYPITVIHNRPIAKTSTAKGDGLYKARTDTQSFFLVTTRDLHVNDVQSGGASILVTLVHESNLKEVEGSCQDLANGQYSCSYMAKHTGVNLLNVELAYGSDDHPLPISGSPFQVLVTAGPAVGANSVAEGNALKASVAGQETSFTLLIKDAFNNDKMNSVQENINVVFLGPLPEINPAKTVSSSTKHEGGNAYTVVYTMELKGVYEIHIDVNGEPIHDSPFSMYTYPSIATSYTSTLDLLSPSASSLDSVIFIAGVPIEMKLTTRDAYRNELESGGNVFRLGDAIKVLEDPIIDQRDGTYLLNLRPTLSEVIPFTPQLMVFGGLNASYFSNPNLRGNPSLQRVDSVIDFDFNVLPPIGTNAMEVYSIQWNGYVSPLYSQNYWFAVECQGDASIRVRDNIVYRKMMHSLSSEIHSKIYLLAHELVPIQINYSKPLALPFDSVRLYWEGYWQAREVISGTHLATEWPIVNNIPPLEILPAPSHPPSFTTEFNKETNPERDEQLGRFQVQGTAGEWFHFDVYARDEFSNLRLESDERIFVIVPGMTDSSSSEPTLAIDDKGNGTYKVSFMPIKMGNYAMTVAAVPLNISPGNEVQTDSLLTFLHPYTIYQSPFALHIMPNAPTAETSDVFGGGLSLATAGEMAYVDIVPRDLHFNAVGEIDLIDLWMKAWIQIITAVDDNVAWNSTARKVDLSYISSSNGVYRMTYTPQLTGVYGLYLAFDDNTPMQKASSIVVKPNIAIHTTSKAIPSSSGLISNVDIDKDQYFQIQLRDAYNNPLESGGDDLIVTVRGPEVVYGNITDLDNGQYVVTYKVSKTGSYEIQVDLARQHKDRGLTGYYYASNDPKAPFALHKIDDIISFDWKTLLTMRVYPRIHWEGYMEPRFSENYTLSIEADRGAILSIDGTPVIDTVHSPQVPSTTSAEATLTLYTERLYFVSLEYHRPTTRSEYGHLYLRWQSDRQPKEIIPNDALFSGSDEIYPRYYVEAV